MKEKSYIKVLDRSLKCGKSFPLKRSFFAGVAQQAAQLTCNEKVTGSIPVTGRIPYRQPPRGGIWITLMANKRSCLIIAEKHINIFKKRVTVNEKVLMGILGNIFKNTGFYCGGSMAIEIVRIEYILRY